MLSRTSRYSDGAGLRKQLREIGNKIARAINENMTWLADAAAKKLMIALLAMRNHKAEYRLNPRLLTRHQFLATYQQFAQTFDGIDGIPEMEMKQKFQSEVKDRANTFVQWIQVSDTIHRGDPGGSGPRPGRTQFYDFADHAANQALGGGHAGQAARGLDEARNELERTQQATDTMSTEAQTAEQRVGAASDNVTATASSLDEVAASIGEIATQAAKSIDVAGRPVSQAQRTVATMSELANAATRIGEVIGLI